MQSYTHIHKHRETNKQSNNGYIQEKKTMNSKINKKVVIHKLCYPVTIYIPRNLRILTTTTTRKIESSIEFIFIFQM